MITAGPQKLTAFVHSPGFWVPRGIQLTSWSPNLSVRETHTPVHARSAWTPNTRRPTIENSIMLAVANLRECVKPHNSPTVNAVSHDVPMMNSCAWYASSVKTPLHLSAPRTPLDHVRALSLLMNEACRIL